MAKIKTGTAYVCSECGADYQRWMGQCSQCKAWNALKQLRVARPPKQNRADYTGFAGEQSAVQRLAAVELAPNARYSSGMQEFDRVLGGGYVPGSVILLGGDPGAGKSTILLQSLAYLAETRTVLYVSGEESLQQIAERAKRLNLKADKLQLLAETSIERICAAADDEVPAFIVIDSIQVMHHAGVDSAPGGVAQVRECAAQLARYAKQRDICLLIIGHVTKDSTLAGPMTLSHIVDTQIMLSSTDDARFRLMRTSKNRFGAVNELGVFAMTDKGLKEVRNPSAIFLARTERPLPGSLVTVLWEGTRPLLVEIQALVVESQFGNPRRLALGIDSNRLAMLLAVLTRHGGLHTVEQDVFLNVVGGIRVSETSADLAVILSVVSSLRNLTIPHEVFAFGEIGLSGEIRPVANGESRINEACKHGFKKAFVPKANMPKRKPDGVDLIGVNRLAEALDAL